MYAHRGCSMRRRIVLMTATFCLAVLAGTIAALSAPSSAPAKSAPSNPKDATPSSPPMVFFLAKGEPNACGPGCSEWVAADGRFDLDAPDRLRALLKRFGGRKLPVYFRTPGGLMSSAIAIGRLMREKKLQTGVATTIPEGCNP